MAETHPTSGDRFKYTSREWDSEIGQYFYRARYYGPGIGRFESEDPLGFKAGDTNVYRYVLNDPTIKTDPSGLFGLQADNVRFVGKDPNYSFRLIITFPALALVPPRGFLHIVYTAKNVSTFSGFNVQNNVANEKVAPSEQFIAIINGGADPRNPPSFTQTVFSRPSFTTGGKWWLFLQIVKVKLEFVDKNRKPLAGGMKGFAATQNVSYGYLYVNAKNMNLPPFLARGLPGTGVHILGSNDIQGLNPSVKQTFDS